MQIDGSPQIVENFGGASKWVRQEFGPFVQVPFPSGCGDISTVTFSVNSTISHRETGQNLIKSFSSLNKSEAEIDSNTISYY